MLWKAKPLPLCLQLLQLQKPIIFNLHISVQMLGFFEENKVIVHLKHAMQISSYTLTAWRASKNNFFRSRPHNHHIKSSGPFPSVGKQNLPAAAISEGVLRSLLK